MARTKDPALEAQRQETVLDAVVELLVEGSWKGMTLARVAQRAGVSKGVVTYWFPSKDALIVGAIQRFHDDYEQLLLQIASEPLPVRERLERLVEAAFPSQEQVAREARFQAEVWSYAKDHPEVAAEVTAAYDHFRLACEALLHLGVVEGYVRTEQIDGLYRFVHALIDGLSLHVAWDPDVDLPAVRARLIALLERWFEAP